MHIKSKKKISLVILNVLLVFTILSSSVNAQVTYEMGVDRNDEFVWEITDLDVNKFKATFGSEPNFQVGSQIRMIIREVDDILGLRWSVLVEFWDYGTDWALGGSIETISIQRYPSQYDDYIFIPTPVGDYIEEAMETLPTQYYTYGGNVIGKQDVSDIGVNFKVEKTYNIDGILTTETYLDEADLIIVKLDATFQIIPFGFSFLAFMSLTIVGMIVFIRQKKKISLIKN